MRVYVGTTFDGLHELHRTFALGSPPVPAHAVTPALRESYAEGDTEELEYVAMTAAALDSLRLLARGAAAPPRRAVVAADVPDAAVRSLGDDAALSAVDVGVEVPLGRVASISVDDPAAAGVVAAAVAALAAGGDAAALVEDAQAEELMWYATQELGDLLA